MIHQTKNAKNNGLNGLYRLPRDQVIIAKPVLRQCYGLSYPVVT